MEKRRPISYTFEDIKRYNQGLMSRDEMHAFEKASMEDPFLADALEGYMASDIAVAEQHLDNIKQRVTGNESQKEKAVVVAMPQRRFGFMRAAALVIVLIGAGLLTYKILDKKDTPASEQIAQRTTPGPVNTNENKQAGVQDPTDSVVQPAGSSGTIAKADQQNGSATSAEPGIVLEDATAKAQVETGNVPVTELATRDDKAKTETEKERQVAAAPTQQNDIALARQDSYESRNRKTNAFVRQNNQFRGRVLTPNNQPLANANIQLDKYRTEIVTDELGNFELNVKDSVVLATVESYGYMDTRVQLRSNTENTINIGNIVLQPDPSIEKEIAVTGLGVKKEKRIADTLSTKPEGGWISFQQYVSNQLNIPLDTTGRDMRLSGELELEFFVDANGDTKDFKVINSTNPQLNQQAIEAVKKGPKWASRKKKARILIRY